MKKINALSRAEMKKVLGGVENPDWCQQMGSIVCDWTCNNSDQSLHLGTMTCNEAQSACPFGNLHGGGCGAA